MKKKVGDIMSSNSSAILSASIFLDELMRISSDIVWKNIGVAKSCEKKEYAAEVDTFIAANKGLLNFDTIQRFEYEVLIAAGLSEEQAIAGSTNKWNIPEASRKTVVSTYLSMYLAKDSVTGQYKNYTEHNNYYRMLYGLPDEEDTEFLYNTKYPEYDQKTPVHLLPITTRYILEEKGYFAELLKENPTKKYLKHLASKSIDFYKSREAGQFDILWMKSSDYGNIAEDFKEQYNNCKACLNSVYYIAEFRKNHEYYDNFMAMSCLFMTLQMMFQKYLEVDISRDFYDLESLRYIYDSYGVPFYSSIPLEYHQKIVKNINRLLSYKGSTQVFYELFDLFGFGSMDIFEYYILKIHKFDRDGKPIFVYNEDGSFDNKAMFDIKFGKVCLYNDPALELSDTTNHVDYESIVSNDKFWISDAELMDKLYSEKYNYLEQKYLGIQTVFNITNIMYEAIYFFRLLMDKRDDLEDTSVYYNPLSTYVRIFDITIYVAALICKKYGYYGQISANLPIIAKIYGYDFSKDVETIRNYIANNPTLSEDRELDQYFTSMNVMSLSSINNTYKKIMNLREYLSRRVTESASPSEYQSYRNLYKECLTAEGISEIYKKSDGNIAKSFADLLADINPELYIRYTSLSTTGIQDEIDTVLSLYDKTFSNLKYIEYADGIDINVLIEHLFKILDYFKSAKSELTGYNIVYIISDAGLEHYKLLSLIERISERGLKVKSDMTYLDDIIEAIRILTKYQNRLELVDYVGNPKYKIMVKSAIDKLTDLITYYKVTYKKALETTVDLVDSIPKYHENKTLNNDGISLSDMLILRHYKEY